MKKIIVGILAVIALIKLVNYETKNYHTAIVTNPISEKYNLEWHPENNKRISYVIATLKKYKLYTQVAKFKAREATTQEIALAHTNEYINSVRKWSKDNDSTKWLTREKWSSYPGEYAYKSAASAVGGLIDLTEKVANGEYKNGFALIRPPGHHAMKDKAMGFCIFNNVAIAALNLLQKNLAKNILVVDIDAHFGNGIENIIHNNQNIEYISIQQDFIFPYYKENSHANILSKNIPFNFPQSEHIRLIKSLVNQSIQKQRPDFIIVAAGYDTHWRDFMSNLSMTSSGHGEVAKYLIDQANTYSNGKIVFSLEGGYDLQALSEGVTNTIKALLGQNDFINTIGKGQR